MRLASGASSVFQRDALRASSVFLGGRKRRLAPGWHYSNGSCDAVAVVCGALSAEAASA
jgi:hypothetical protein